MLAERFTHITERALSPSSDLHYIAGVLLRSFMCLVICAAASAHAQRYSPMVWDSALSSWSPPALHVWLTPHYGRVDGNYAQLDFRFQIAQRVASRLDAMLGLDTEMAAFGQGGQAVDGRVSTTWRYVVSPMTETIGFATIGSLSVGPGSFRSELRLVLDKSFGALWFGLNASAEGIARFQNTTEADARFEQSLAARYALHEHFALGLEARAKEALAKGAYLGTALTVGPTFSFMHEHWWATLTFAAQVGADKAPADRGNGEALELRDNERFMGRLIIGIPLPK